MKIISKLWCVFSRRAHQNAVVLSRGKVLIPMMMSWAVGAQAAPTPTPSASLPVQAVTVTSARDAVRVGDLLPYTLTEGPGTHVDPKSGGIGKGYSFLKNGGRYYFIPLVAGEISVPSLPILNDEETIVAKSEAFNVQALSVIDEKEREKAEPAPAIGPQDLPFPPFVQNIIGFLVLLMIGFAVYAMIRWSKRRAARLLKKWVPQKPVDQRALEALNLLEKKGAFAEGKHKQLHFGISEILKSYLGERFHFDASESTTDEMIQGLRAKHGVPKLTEPLIDQIVQCFAVLDLVKFTDYVPRSAESRAQFELARKIVLESREVKVEIR